MKIINDQTMTKYLLKWTMLVWLNAIISFIFGLIVYVMDAHTEDFSQSLFILGMIAGVFTFVLIYALIDYKAYQANKIDICQSLIHSVIIKGILQFTLIFEFFAGVGALMITQLKFFGLSNANPSFLFSYLSTLITGLLLSIPVGLLTYLLSLRKKYK